MLEIVMPIEISLPMVLRPRQERPANSLAWPFMAASCKPQKGVGLLFLQILHMRRERLKIIGIQLSFLSTFLYPTTTCAKLDDQIQNAFLDI